MVDVVLPAGGQLEGEFAAQTGVSIKALLPLNGVTILQRTLETLRSWPPVGRMVVIGPGELQQHPSAALADAVLEGHQTGPENILRGLEWLSKNRGEQHARVLIAATDVPFLSREALDDFVGRCPEDADICLPVVSRKAFEAKYPGLPGPYVRLRDGEWTLGCVSLLNPVTLGANRLHLERVFAARKSQVAMGRLLGPMFILRYVCRQIGVREIEERCRQILRCTGAAVLDCAPELAFDVDLPDEYAFVLKHIAH